MKKIAIIGAGKMGTAIHEALKGKFDVQLCGRGEEGIRVCRAAEVVIFCVKPQDFDVCAEGMGGDFSKQLVISIMAGVSLKTLMKKTGASAVVRSMPNLPVQIGKGFTAWICTKAVKEKEFVRSIFASFGEEMEVQNEDRLNEVTALSGSGPGYFFYFCEVLEEKAKEWGFSEEDARKIVRATFAGSAKLLETGEKSAGEWKLAVKSKGGTTEAALGHLEKNGFGDLMKEAMQAAKKRSQEL